MFQYGLDVYRLLNIRSCLLLAQTFSPHMVNLVYQTASYFPKSQAMVLHVTREPFCRICWGLHLGLSASKKAWVPLVLSSSSPNDKTSLLTQSQFCGDFLTSRIMSDARPSPLPHTDLPSSSSVKVLACCLCLELILFLFNAKVDGPSYEQ